MPSGDLVGFLYPAGVVNSRLGIGNQLKPTLPASSKTELMLPASLTIFPFDRAGIMGPRTIGRFSLLTEITVPVKASESASEGR